MQRAKQRTIKAFAKELAFAKGEGSQRRQNILQDEHEELRLIDDEMGIEVSQRPCRQAAHYLVPVPQGKDDWEESSIFGTRFLTRAGASKLRADLRAEQKARWEYWQSRIQLVGTVIGIIGGIMGALAYFKPPFWPRLDWLTCDRGREATWLR
jgi:hypothetical protein